MAGNNYKLLIEAQLDPAKIDAQIKALSDKSVMIIKTQFDKSDFSKFEGELAKIAGEVGNKIGKISLFKNDSGGINKAVVEYTDALGNAVKQTIAINQNVKSTQVYTQNLAKDEAGVVKLQEQQVKLTAKQADEMQRAALNAEKFLAKSSGMDSKNPAVASAIGTANGIKQAVSDGDINQVRKLTDQLAIEKSALSSVGQGVRSWSESMAGAIKQTVSYSLSIGLVYGALNQLKEGIQYVKDLNKELTNIQLVTGGTDAETAKLATGYNDLAKEMGATTIEIAKGSLEFIRQGKTAEETATLIKNSTMMAKLGNMDEAASSEALTSIMNGFKLTAEETGAVVDKLVSIDNVAATSVQELSNAMQYSSSTAQQVGIDFDHLAAYIGTISAVTRRSSEEIGQSMKTVALRMTAIKDMKAFDSEGESVNKVESALAGVNVKLRDNQGHFRDMQDVLDELAGKWSDFSREEQIFIAQQIGGVRQADKLLALLSNEAEIQKQLNAERDSTNLRLERYDIYLKSIEASQNKMTASWEEMVSSGATKDMITDWYNAGTAILGFVNAIGGIPTVLKILIPLLVAFNLELIYTKSIAFGNSVLGIVSAFKSLIGLLPGVASGYGAVATAEGVATTGAVAFTTAQAAATLGITALIAAFIYGIKVIHDFKVAQDEILNGVKEQNDESLKTATSYEQYVSSVKKAGEAAGYLYDEQGRMYKEGYHGATVYVDGMKLLDEAMWNAINTTDSFDRAQGRVESTVTTATDAIMTETEKLTSFSETLKGLADTASTVDDLISKSNSSEGLSLSDASKIPPEYLDSLTVVGDKLSVNIDLLKQTQLEQAATALSAIQSAEEQGNATSQQVEVIQMAYNQLLAESQNTYGAFSQTAWDYDALLWQISNDAINAGYTAFTNTEGNAMNSARAIHDFMASSTGNFNNFVQQAANATGQSVVAVMNTANQMATATYNSTMQMLNSLEQNGEAMYAKAGYIASGGNPNAIQATTANIFSGVAPVIGFGGYGGGSYSGGGSSSDNSAQQAADKAAQAAADKAKALAKAIEDSRKNAIEDLNDELKIYNKIIDAQKKILDQMAEERNYQQDLNSKQDDVLLIQNELSDIQFDDSEEANAKRLQLEEQLAQAQQELENVQYDHSITQQKDALDAEYDAFESRINNAISQIEDINATTLASFAQKLAVIMAGLGTLPSHHSGIERGAIGGKNTKSSEQFIKALKGEVVVNESQMKDYLQGKYSNIGRIAEYQSNSNGGGIEINMPVTVAGNLDKEVLPDLENMINKAFEKFNGVMRNKGYTRNANSYSI